MARFHRQVTGSYREAIVVERSSCAISCEDGS